MAHGNTLNVFLAFDFVVQINLAASSDERNFEKRPFISIINCQTVPMQVKSFFTKKLTTLASAERILVAKVKMGSL